MIRVTIEAENYSGYRFCVVRESPEEIVTSTRISVLEDLTMRAKSDMKALLKGEQS